MAEHVTHKLIKSGNIVEIYVYSEGYLKGFKLSKADVNSRKDVTSSESESDIDIRKRSLQRAKVQLRRLINANVGQYGSQFTSKFLTLTFAKNVTDLKIANYEFTKFVKRLNYRIYGENCSKLKYTSVIEFQKRGAIHFHVIVYNMPYMRSKDISDLWTNGFIKVNKIDEIDNVGAYIGEYLGKVDKGQGRDVIDDRLKGQKSYFSSRGLFKPVEITDKKIVEQFAAALPLDSLRYSSTFSNEHLGDVLYIQYNLNDSISKVYTLYAAKAN